jgi:ABC-type ATPase with predicted acetyltransferase domain
MIIEHKSSIQKDKYTDYVVQSFDIQDADNSNVIINANLENIPNHFNVGVIYGGSGSGKTSILKKYFNKEIDKSYFDKDKALISNFDWLSPEDATQLLSSMGLSSVPTWLRPFHVLSNGEQYRANLAYIVGRATQQDVILIDEYTSVVDRDVAKAMSNASSISSESILTVFPLCISVNICEPEYVNFTVSNTSRFASLSSLRISFNSIVLP